MEYWIWLLFVNKMKWSNKPYLFIWDSENIKIIDILGPWLIVRPSTREGNNSRENEYLYMSKYEKRFWRFCWPAWNSASPSPLLALAVFWFMDLYVKSMYLWYGLSNYTHRFLGLLIHATYNSRDKHWKIIRKRWLFSIDTICHLIS